MVVMSICKACVLAGGGGATNRGALHLFQRLVTADVSQAAMTGATAPFGAIHGHVVAAPQHVTRTEVAKNWGAHHRGATMSTVTLLGGVHHAVDISRPGGWPSRGWLGSLLVPVEINIQEQLKKDQTRTGIFLLC